MRADVQRVWCYDEQEPQVVDGAGRGYSDEVYVVMQNAAGQTVACVDR